VCVDAKKLESRGLANVGFGAKRRPEQPRIPIEWCATTSIPRHFGYWQIRRTQRDWVWCNSHALRIELFAEGGFAQALKAHVQAATGNSGEKSWFEV
jgi:hypothetical protein